MIPYFPPPDEMDLGGDPIPLHIGDVRERFDREFTLIVYNHSQVYLWLKRMERYFPWAEERLRYYKMPDDLKYVAIVESDLLPNACSPKGAAGAWQFMPATGSQYGLDRQGCYDERYDFERATDCAFRYLNNLYKRFKNWPLAIAAYNCGEGRIQEQMRAQKVGDYFHMKLPTETERYVFRILAVKAVLGSPAQYGYYLPKGQGYPEFKVDRVNVTLTAPTTLHALAAASGVSYREFKRLNPTFTADSVQAGAFEVKVPQGMGRSFEQNVSSAGGRLASGPAVSDDDSDAVVVEESSEQAKPRVTLVRSEKEPAGREVKSRPAKQESDAEASSKKQAAKEQPPVTAPKDPKTQMAAATGLKDAEASKSKAGDAKSSAQSRESQAKSSGGTTHKVQKGDTLLGIAQHYKVNVDVLRKANNLKGNNITLGQKLVIP